MMEREDTLARLLAQAHEDGADLVTLRAIAEEASELGAERLLGRLGLADASASGDIGELRELLGAWRDAKRSALHAAVEWFVRGLCALLLLGIAMRLGVPALFR